MSEKQKIKELLEAIHDLDEILKVLGQDFIDVTNKLFQDASNFWLRIYIRAFFALVEGATYSLKQIAIQANDLQPCLTDAELSLLKEITCELNENGEVKLRSRYLEILSNIRFTFKAIKKVFKMEFEINFIDNGWQNFRDSLKIRHQITHPKNAHDLLVSELDNGQGKKVVIIADASRWYMLQISMLINEIKISSKSYKNKVK